MAKLKTSTNRLNQTGIFIRKYRELHNLSLREFAKLVQIGGLDWDYHIVSRSENGSRIISDIEVIKLAEILRVSIESLLDEHAGENH